MFFCKLAYISPFDNFLLNPIFNKIKAMFKKISRCLGFIIMPICRPCFICVHLKWKLYIFIIIAVIKAFELKTIQLILTGSENVVRLPIIISCGHIKKLLQVPALKSEIGREQASAVCNVIQELQVYLLSEFMPEILWKEIAEEIFFLILRFDTWRTQALRLIRQHTTY